MVQTTTQKTQANSLERKIEQLELTPAQQRELKIVLSKAGDYVWDDVFNDPRLHRCNHGRRCPRHARSHGVPRGRNRPLSPVQLCSLSAKPPQGRHQPRTLNQQPSKNGTPKVVSRQGRACSKIITSNMGLVLALGRRSGHLGVEFSELVSEGSMALLRATENFDCGRGFKFSTYAWRAITRAFLRLAKEHSRYYRLFSVQWDPMLENENTTDWRQKLLSQERVAELRTIMSRNLADLSGVEQSVVAMRFPFDRGHKRPRTLSEVGHELGLSKERIRQIQVKALKKLRDVAEDRILRP